MDSNFAQLAITAILGGGLFKGFQSIYSAIVLSREKKALADAAGAKTPVEIESLSVSTMASALQSAQGRIVSLEIERTNDREYYLGRIGEYQVRVAELMDQLEHLRRELATMEHKVSELLSEVHDIPTRKEKTV